MIAMRPFNLITGLAYRTPLMLLAASIDYRGHLRLLEAKDSIGRAVDIGDHHRKRGGNCDPSKVPALQGDGAASAAFVAACTGQNAANRAPQPGSSAVDRPAPTDATSVDASDHDEYPTLHLGNSVLIGVAHDKPFNLSRSTMAKIQAAAQHGVYHEGPFQEEHVKQFVNKHLGGQATSWEPPDVKPGEDLYPETIANNLFGGTTEALSDQMVSHPKYNPSASILDNLMATADKWNHNPGPDYLPRADDIQNAVNLVANDPKARGVHPDAGRISELLHGPMKNLKRYHDAGQLAAWPEDAGLPKGHTDVSRAVGKVNARRDQQLLQHMKVNGGVYFAGSDHVADVNRLNTAS
jgi:hypothetical protein